MAMAMAVGPLSDEPTPGEMEARRHDDDGLEGQRRRQRRRRSAGRGGPADVGDEGEAPRRAAADADADAGGARGGGEDAYLSADDGDGTGEDAAGPAAAAAEAREPRKDTVKDMINVYYDHIELDEDDHDEAAEKVDADTMRRLAALIHHFYIFVQGKFRLPIFINVIQRVVQLVFSLLAWVFIRYIDYDLDKERALELLFRYLVVVADPAELVLLVQALPDDSYFDQADAYELVQLRSNLGRQCDNEDLADALKTFVLGFQDFNYLDIEATTYAFVVSVIFFILGFPALVLEVLNMSMDADDVDSIPQTIRGCLVALALPFDALASLLVFTAACALAAIATLGNSDNSNIPQYSVDFSFCEYQGNYHFCALTNASAVFMFLLALSFHVSLALDVMATVELIRQSRREMEAEAAEALLPGRRGRLDGGDADHEDRGGGDGALGAREGADDASVGTASDGDGDVVDADRGGTAASETSSRGGASSDDAWRYTGPAYMFVPMYASSSAAGKFALLVERAWTSAARWSCRSYLTKMVSIRILQECLIIVTLVLIGTGKTDSVYCVFQYDLADYDSITYLTVIIVLMLFINPVMLAMDAWRFFVVYKIGLSATLARLQLEGGGDLESGTSSTADGADAAGADGRAGLLEPEAAPPADGGGGGAGGEGDDDIVGLGLDAAEIPYETAQHVMVWLIFVYECAFFVLMLAGATVVAAVVTADPMFLLGVPCEDVSTCKFMKAVTFFAFCILGTSVLLTVLSIARWDEWVHRVYGRYFLRPRRSWDTEVEALQAKLRELEARVVAGSSEAGVPAAAGSRAITSDNNHHKE